MSILMSAPDLRDGLARADILAVDTRPAADWRVSTIPGAVRLNVYDYFVPESTTSGHRGMAAGARAAFEAVGVAGADRVAWFEEETGMRSPRGLWFQELLGLPGGRILDGGLAAWRATGGETAHGEAAEADIAHRDDLPPPEGWQPLLAATTDQVLHPASDRDILDVRRRSEFEGSFRHECCARAGRIPGAKFLFYEDMLSDGRYRRPEEIREVASTAGLDPEREIVTYCHRGARAATALYGLRLAGFWRVRSYVGSWHEWARNTALPSEAGSL